MTTFPTRYRDFVLVAGLLASGFAPLHAQQPLTLERIRGPITLDGLSDEPAWQAITPLPVSAHYPNFGGEATERTEFLVAYDDEYLYAAGRMYDSDPDGIRDSTLRRDHDNLSTDWFGVDLDTFNDKENMLMFATNPAGIRTDFAWEGDGADVKTDWNTFWDVAVKRTDEGWFAEMRIPLSSLRFQEQDGRVVMGMIVWRHIARKNERMTYPAIEPKWGFRTVVKASRAQEVVLEGVKARTAVAVTPYVLGGAGRSQELNEAGTAYTPLEQDVQEAGVSLKYGVTNNLTLDLTYNTDFAQVEADDREINLTRFSISLPEKRPFFLERSSAFEFETGDDGQLFYSRRIGIENGRQVPIVGGARLVGRAGDWDLALLDMQTDAADGVQSANYGVARVRRRVLNENSYVGAIATSRVANGESHVALGADALLRLGREYLTLSTVGVGGDAAPGVGDGVDRSLVRARLERRGNFGLRYHIEAARIGTDFAPPVGFVPRTGHVMLAGKVSQMWKMSEGSRILRQGLNVGGASYRRSEDGTWESARIGTSWEAELKSGRVLLLGAGAYHEKLATEFELADDVTVPAGAYSYPALWFEHTSPEGSLFRPDLELDFGSFYDGWKVEAAFLPTWSVSKYLELGGVYRFSHVAFPDRDQVMTVHLARLRSRVMLSTRISISGFAQYHSETGGAILNLRLRYNPSEGHDLFLVYDEGLNTERDGLLPRPPLSARRSIMLKYSRTLRLQLPR